MKKIDVYDFDKTIYKKDSTLEFYKYCLIENISLVKYIPIQICYLILFKATRKDIYKQKFFIFLREIDNIDEKIDLFWKKNINDIRFNIINGENDKIVVSASPEFLLEKICEKIGINKVIGTKVDKFTGKFYAENCYGAEKLKRLNDEYTENYEIERFYTDSVTDKYLAQKADKPFIIKRGKIKKWNIEKKK